MFYYCLVFDQVSLLINLTQQINRIASSLLIKAASKLPKNAAVLAQHSSNPLYEAGGIDFLKFGNKGRNEIFFLEREGLD